MRIYEFGYKQTYFKRNLYGTYDQIKEWVQEVGDKDVYRSVFGYENQDIDNCALYGGIYFDLDNKSNLNFAYQDLMALLDFFNIQGIEANNFFIYFSGSKGFHLNFKFKALGILPSPDLDQVYKLIARDINKYLPNHSIDTTVYERKRLWRIVNSINGKSGLYKIQLKLPLLTLPEILRLAKSPQDISDIKDQKPNPILTGWVARARRELSKSKKPDRRAFSGNKNIHPEVQKLLEGVDKNRNHTTYYIACYLHSKGFAEDQIRQILLDFGNRCNPPASANFSDFNVAAIERTLRSALKGGHYGDNK